VPVAAHDPPQLALKVQTRQSILYISQAARARVFDGRGLVEAGQVSDVLGPMPASYTPAMKAAVCTRYGPPEVVVISEVEKPATGDNGLLVKVHATTVNRTDCAYRAARPFFMRFLTGLIRPRSTVLDTEFAGVVEAVGSGVTSFGVGDKVFGYNEGPFGAHAEYLSVPEDGSVATMPASVTYQQAAPSTEGSHYALAHIKAAKIHSGQDILVYGATGAIGSAAVQLLKSLGANVTAVCGTDHVELVSGLGADKVIDYTAENFTKDNQRYDAVLDSVGKSSFSQCKGLLKPRGIYISSELVLWPRIRSVRSLPRCMAARRSCSPFRSMTS